jgi:dTDP-4-dehydrorhamnose reductase
MKSVSPARILVLGGTGSLGHKLFHLLRQHFPNTYCTIREQITDDAIRHIELFQSGNVIERCDADDARQLEAMLRELRPDVIVNCIGVIKQRPSTNNIVASLKLNSLLPHELSEICKAWNGKLIHFSTDCVFSGARGNYREEDVSDATDIYGRTKYLGETCNDSALTLRTSFIGRELRHHHSLLDWFLRQNHGKVNGYSHAFFSGLTNIELARVVARIIESHADLTGVYQVTGHTISKFELLCLIRDAFRLDIEIQPDPSFQCNRSMVGERFARATGYTCPAWPELVAEIANDTTPYDRWEGSAA